MPYALQQPKVRRSPLRFSDFNQMVENQRETFRLLTARHTTDGVHNDDRVPRAVALVRYNSGYSIAGGTSGVSVSSSGTGIFTLTLSSGRFASTPLLVSATVAESGSSDSPWLVNYEVLSATSVRFRLYNGPSWALANGSVAVAIHAPPVGVLPDSGFLEPLLFLEPSATLTASDWSALATNTARLRAAIDAEHFTTDGVHDCWEVARAAARVTWSGSAYALADESVDFASVTQVATGKIGVTLTSGYVPNSSSPKALVLASPQYQSAAGEDWLAQVPLSSYTSSGGYLTGFEVHLLKRTAANTWALTDGNVHLAVHGGA